MMLKKFVRNMKLIHMITFLVLSCVITFNACQKTEYDNPHDSSVSASLWAPTYLDVNQTSLKTAKLTWIQRDTRIDSFCVEAKRGFTEWKVIGYANKTATSYIDSTFIPDPKTHIDYRVGAIAWKNKSYSDSKRITPVFGMPEMPTITKDPGVRLKVSWYDIYNNEDGYKIEKRVNGGSWVLCADTIRKNSTFYYDNNPELNALIAYRISVQAAGICSDASSSIPFSTVIAQPTWFTVASLSQTSCRVDWKQGEDWTTGYKIDRQFGNNPWQDSWLMLDNTKLTFTDANLPTDQDIKYRVSSIVNNSYSIPKVVLYGLAIPDTITTLIPSYTTINLKTKVLDEGGSTVTEWGIVYGTSPNPTIADTKVTSTTPFNTAYTASLTGLDNSKTYYARTYAINRRGESYGPQKTFNLNPFLLPQLSTPVIELTYYDWITASDVIKDQGGAQVSEAGFVISTSPGPTINDIKVVSSTNFPLTNTTYNLWTQIPNLSVGKTYYIRAYAKNIVGVAYSGEKSFTTWNYILPVSAATTLMLLDATKIQVSSRVTDLGGDRNVKYGFVYGTNPNPTMADKVWTDTKVTYLATWIDYNSIITNLTPNQVYHIRSFAQNALGLAYGPDLMATTTNLMVPVLDETTIVFEEFTWATVKSKLIKDGGSTILEAGFVYSTAPLPTIADQKAVCVVNPADNTISSKLDPLQDNTVYYVRSYAINASGIAYGLVHSLQTHIISPAQMDNTTIDAVFPTGAYLESRVINNGGSYEAECGFVYGDNPGPTISDHKVVVFTGNVYGKYAGGLSLLLPDHQYYIRSYVKNPREVAYGPDVVITTKSLSLPLFNTLTVGLGVSNSTFFNCQIISDGGYSYIETGFVYSTHPGPTISDSKVLAYRYPNIYGIYDQGYTIKGLTLGQTFYVRCFATTSLGTGYSEEKSFTPLP